MFFFRRFSNLQSNVLLKAVQVFMNMHSFGEFSFCKDFEKSTLFSNENEYLPVFDWKNLTFSSLY